MNKPVRIQRKRTKGWKMPENTVYVGRPGYFGNPFLGDKAKAAQLYRRWLTGRLSRAEWEKHETTPLWHWWDKDNVKRELPRLKGKNLACWCPLEDENGNPVPCHADVLLELANAPISNGE